MPSKLSCTLVVLMMQALVAVHPGPMGLIAKTPTGEPGVGSAPSRFPSSSV